MELAIDQMFAMQKELDERIAAEHQLQHENTAEKKVLALLVELGELANETRCFKFWSLKPPSKKTVILEEYVDGLHFILSLGLDYGFRPDNSPPRYKGENPVSGFLAMFEETSSFRRRPSQQRYSVLFFIYIALGESLGLTTEDIQMAYGEKNRVNHKRQDSGY